jgi:catechol 2,3-dioxygenase-like lactoylglutathione lyase family enzyme
MIDHLTLLVRDYARSRDFYLRTLAPLGYELVMEFSRAQIPESPVPNVCGLGAGGKPDLWLRDASVATTATHLAFTAPNRAAVDSFYRAALAAGATPNGDPGLRPQYHPNYYGAFVIDPNGHNLEAVCHAPG